MEMRQLEFFAAAAETGNFTQAAAAQHVTESGLQKQIRNLERELGITLFARAGRAVRLTSDGQQLLSKVKSLLSTADDIKNLAHNLDVGKEGLVTIGCYPVHVTKFLGPIIAGFKTQHPEIHVRLGEHPGDQVVEGRRDLYENLFKGETDFVVGPLIPSGISSIVAYQAHGIAVLPDNHEMRFHETFSIENLRNEPLLCLPPGLWFRNQLQDACADAGFRPRIELETTTDSLMALSHAGYGIGVLSDDNIFGRHEHDYPRLVTVKNARLEATNWLQWRSDRPLSRAGKEFISYVETSFDAANKA